MKKLVVMAMACVLMATTMTGCSSKPTTVELGLEEIVTKMYEIKQPEMPVGAKPTDMNDAAALKYDTGLDSVEGISELYVSETMMGAQAYSLVLVRVSEGTSVEDIATAMNDGIDTRKWICVEADDKRVVATGDVVMLAMVSTEFKDMITATDLVDAFTTVTEGELTVDLK